MVADSKIVMLLLVLHVIQYLLRRSAVFHYIPLIKARACVRVCV